MIDETNQLNWPAVTVSDKSHLVWLEIECGNSRNFRPFRFNSPVYAASSSARSILRFHWSIELFFIVFDPFESVRVNVVVIVDLHSLFTFDRWWSSWNGIVDRYCLFILFVLRSINGIATERCKNNEYTNQSMRKEVAQIKVNNSFNSTKKFHTS